MRPLTIQYIRIDSVRLLIKSYETWIFIKYSAIKSYHLEEKQLDVNRSLK